MDKYEIIKVIGEGNYGMAVLVKNILDNNFYVIKEQLSNALYEVEVIKKLQHPFIVKYYESFYEDNFLCIVMEYADCGDLHKLVKSQKKINIPLKEEIILNWFVQLCFAVKYIHEKKILHRDLKLSNVFLCSDGNIKLGDFGISKILGDKEEYAKSIVGTPYYLSPEICLKRPYNNKSDIWSMGCLLYELINLKHAFEASNIGELILKILKGEYEKVEGLFSKDLYNLVEEMLAVETEKRPDLNTILEKPFMLKYIKLNLIRQLSNPNITRYTPNNFLEEENYKFDKIQIKEDSCNLNLNFISALSPSQISVDSNKVSFTVSEELNVYKIASNSSSKNSSERFSHNINKKEENDTNINGDKNMKIDKNSVFSKIEKLKKFLEKFLGLEPFLEIYFKINEYYLNNETKLEIDFEKYKISDSKTKADIIKLIKSLIKFENDLYHH